MKLDILSKLSVTNAVDALNASQAAKSLKAAQGVKSAQGVEKPSNDGKTHEMRQLEKAASDFEAIFINQVLKASRDSSTKVSLFGDSKGEETFTSMLDQEYSNIMSSGEGIGLKESLLKQFALITPAKNDNTDGLSMLKMMDAAQHKPRGEAIEAFKNHIIEETGASGPVDDYKSPIKGRISSFYGLREDPLTGREKFHKGTDIAAPKGTPIYPTMEGVVTFSGKKGGYGNLIEIRHPNGYVSRYAHNASNTAKVGDLVTTEDKIGEVGETGRATGPHLHFELQVEGYAVNPQDMVHLG